MFTCGLLNALKKIENSCQTENSCLAKIPHKVIAFKSGPDYIDPMFHRAVMGVESTNLDAFFSDGEQIREIFRNAAAGKDIAIIEGAMGIYDGVTVSCEAGEFYKAGISKEYKGVRESGEVKTAEAAKPALNVDSAVMKKSGGAAETAGSAYELASALDCPIILIFDAKSFGQTLIYALNGILANDKHGLIKGIVLNRISGSFYESIRDRLPAEPLGYIPVMKDICFDSRHLGLIQPSEIVDINKKLDRISEQIEKTVDLDRLLQIAASAAEMLPSVRDGHECSYAETETEPEPEKRAERIETRGNFGGLVNACGIANGAFCSKTAALDSKAVPRIAYAYDEAFNFYYRENLELLRKYGAELVKFSPLHDKELPKDISGLLIGGGYPELFAEKLDRNAAMRDSIRSAIEAGMPSVAECGGFMYLQERLITEDGRAFDMVGAVPGESRFTGKLQRFGYVIIREKVPQFIKKSSKYAATATGTAAAASAVLKGHEFHYYDSDNNGNSAEAVKVSTGRKYDCIIADDTHFWGYPHLYYPSCPAFAESFVHKCREYGMKSGNKTAE